MLSKTFSCRNWFFRVSCEEILPQRHRGQRVRSNVYQRLFGSASASAVQSPISGSQESLKTLDIQVITTSENERRLLISVKSSRFLVYNVAPRERALKASRQSFNKAGTLPLRSGLPCRILARISPASFQWL